MALSELTSNLSWYGTNAGFKAPQSAEQTRFTLDTGDLTVSSAPRGFDNAGNQSNAFIPKISGNAFNIEGQGTATRLSQLGTGTKFPIGPKGQVHTFDIKRTGFSTLNRYTETFNSNEIKGLAATYTAKSPIDDMYNKFVVRDEAWNPAGKFSLTNIIPAIIGAVQTGLNSLLNTSFSKIDLIDTREPYILTGIQRDGKSDPQRYGLFSTSRFEIPRGGVTTYASRLIRDIARIGKFLTGPHGIEFIAKQQILHVQNVSTESVLGSNNPFGANKFYNPASPILNLAAGAGLHFGTVLVPRKYETIIKNRHLADSVGVPIGVNRLEGLRNDMLWNPSIPIKYFNTTGIDLNFNISRLSTLGGPAPDIIRTLIRRHENTIPLDQKIQVGFGGSKLVSLNTYLSNSFLFRYFGSYGGSPTKYGGEAGVGSTFEGFAPGQTNADKSPLQRRIAEKPEQYVLNELGTGYVWKAGEEFLGGVTKEESQYLANTDPNAAPPVADSVKYKALTYGQIRTARKDRTYKSSAILDSATGTTFSAAETKLGKLLKEKNAGPLADKDKTLPELYAGSDDLVTFKIGDETFRAYISSVSVSDSVSSTQQKEMMAPYAQYYYDSHDRTGGISFIVAALSPAALTAVWNKIKKLQSLLGPVVTADTPGAIRVKSTTLKLGDIFNNTAIIIDSLNFDIDTESPWEITPGYQRPMYVNVDISFTILPTSKTSLPTFS
jgi:hypothetical protein